MEERGIVLVANMGDDSITAYGSRTYEEIFRICLKPEATKLMNINHFARGPMVGPGHICCSAGGEQLLVANIYDDSLSIIDLCSRDVINTMFAGSRPNRIEVFEQASKAFVTNYDSDSVSVIDLRMQQVIGQVPTGIMPQSIVLNRRNNCLYIANTGSDWVTVIDALSMDKQSCLKVDGYPVDILCDGTGRKLYAIVQSHEGRERSCLAEYDIETGKKSGCMRLGTMPVSLLLDQERDRLYVVDAVDDSLTVIDSTGLKALGMIELGKMPVSQSLGSGGKYLHVVCMMENRLYKVDVDTGSVVKTAITNTEPAWVIAVG